MALLGAGWLILKTEGALQARARRQARFCFLATLAAVGVVSLWTPFLDADIARRWFSWPNIAFLAPVPLLTALFGLLEWRAIADVKAELAPFLYAVLPVQPVLSRHRHQPVSHDRAASLFAVAGGLRRPTPRSSWASARCSCCR